MISIVVSIYNGEFFLDRCLESLLKQPKELCEIILVNDGSTDHTGEICDKYKCRYNHIKVVHKENGGLTSARLKGLSVALGEYVVFIDCDDTVSSEWIKKLNTVINNKNNPDMIVYDYTIVLSDEEKTVRKIDIPEILLQNYNAKIYALSSISSGWKKNEKYFKGFLWLRCIKRSILKEEMFISERLCYTEDVLFNLAISEYIKTIIYIPEALYNYHIVKGSLTNKYRENMWEMLLYRQNWIKNYCDKKMLTNMAEERIAKSNWSAVRISCNNACMNADEGLNEVKNICIDVHHQKLIRLKDNFWKLSSIDKIKYILLKGKCYKLYYLIFKKRGK